MFNSPSSRDAPPPALPGGGIDAGAHADSERRLGLEAYGASSTEIKHTAPDIRHETADFYVVTPPLGLFMGKAAESRLTQLPEGTPGLAWCRDRVVRRKSTHIRGRGLCHWWAVSREP